MKNLLLLALFLLSFISDASAMKISEYRARKNSPQQKAQIEIYLQGYIHGVFNANDILEAQGNQPLFCMPDQELFLSKGHYTEFLNMILSKSANYVKDDTSIEIALISTLVNTYPCKTGNPEIKK